MTETFMREALKQAKKAYALGEVPVGAIVVRDGRIIARAYNRRECDKNPLAHAEILALQRAAKKVGGWRLSDCTLYVTLEPCPMCTGACVNARIQTICFGAYDPKAGYCGSLENVAQDERLNHRCEVMGGLLEEECAALLKQFFQERRKKR